MAGSPTRIAGRALAALMGALLRIRGPRPIHTTGVLLSGRISWRPPSTVTSGIAWIDARGSGTPPAVTARFSRGAALPAVLPDVLGLAVRGTTRDGPVDLLLSTTGFRMPGRFVLVPRRTPGGAWFSILMPYRGTHGPVQVAARSRTPPELPARMADLHDRLLREPWRLELLFASPAGRWHRFADLELTALEGRIDGDAPRFDAVRHPPPGAGTYGWGRRLREAAYARARRG
ncbi:MAG TPA: hypothetical protein VGO26_09390 [Amnibacterium sp.]|jgi:hypothetical protein|nr:hypothetical protein [Amnibacterium sp.]